MFGGIFGIMRHCHHIEDSQKRLKNLRCNLRGVKEASVKPILVLLSVIANQRLHAFQIQQILTKFLIDVGDFRHEFPQNT